MESFKIVKQSCIAKNTRLCLSLVILTLCPGNLDFSRSFLGSGTYSPCNPYQWHVQIPMSLFLSYVTMRNFYSLVSLSVKYDNNGMYPFGVFAVVTGISQCKITPFQQKALDKCYSVFYFQIHHLWVTWSYTNYLTTLDFTYLLMKELDWISGSQTQVWLSIAWRVCYITGIVGLYLSISFSRSGIGSNNSDFS